MNPPDSMAYKPEGSEADVTPYAEVKLPHTHVSMTPTDSYVRVQQK